MEFALGGAPDDGFRLPGPNGARVTTPWKLWRVVANAAAPGPGSPDYAWGLKMIRLLNESRCC